MKHVKIVSKSPSRAQDLTLGSILTVVGQLLTVFASFFTSKESSSTK